MFVGQRLLGISRDFWRAEDEECEYNGKSGYNDDSCIKNNRDFHFIFLTL